MDVQAKLNEGRDHHQAGRFGDAGRCYKAVLEADPDNVDALNLMSVLAQMSGDNQVAAQLALRAIELQPDWHPPYVALGNALQAGGRADLAVEAFQNAVTLAPEQPEAYINLSSALNELGRYNEAVKMAVEAVIIDGSLPDAHINFGNALAGLDSHGEAIEAYQKAAFLRPDWDLPWFNIGVSMAADGRHDEAAAVLEKSISLADAPAKRFNLANSLAALERWEPALAEYRAALALDPGYVDAHNNLGALLKDLERLDEAESCLRHALTLAPDAVDLHWNLSLVLLMQGKWSEGWAEYEHRWSMPTFQPFVRDFGKPQWQGEDPAGKTVLITAEQGFGDAIEFCRFAPILAARGAKVIVECRKGLERLFNTLNGIDTVVALGARPEAFDLTIPMMSLPHVLGLGMEDLPGPVPYLSVPAGAGDFSDVAAAPGRKIGIVWAGGEARRDNRQRSCTAKDMAVLAGPGTSLFSLQVGPAAPQAADIPGLVDLSPRLGDFADTAAAISALDMVISVDTGVVHLAGALGKPVWVLLSKPSNGFLWMTGRDDSPWHPTARLFRQSVSGDWAELLARVVKELG